MPSVSYRKARREDFPSITQLLRSTVDGLLKQRGFFETSPFASPRVPPPNPQQGFPWFENALEEDGDGFWVAEVDNHLGGIGLSWVRGPLWYLAHLFISPEHQGLNIGQTLLDKTLEHQGTITITNRALVTFAYNPVSISLYSRYGMYPREPLYFMEASRDQVKPASATERVRGERLETFEAHRKILSKIDIENTGYVRERNHRFLFSLPTVQCYLFSQDQKPVGYAYIWKSGRIGPLAALTDSGFKEMVESSIELALRMDSPSVGMLVTGSNETLMKIAFHQKMRILDNFLFMSSNPFPNFSKYILYPTGAML
jgi:ribosomal protein S18 acetylase RimI-like enzyme